MQQRANKEVLEWREKKLDPMFQGRYIRKYIDGTTGAIFSNEIHQEVRVRRTYKIVPFKSLDG